MNQTGIVEKAEYLLKSLLFDPFISPRLKELAWPSELDRWHHMVYALLAQVYAPPEEDLGTLVDYLGNLGHLQVGKLVQIDLIGGSADPSGEEASRILAVLRDHGYSEEASLRALTLICEVARGLESNYGGKIQRYLRAYGEAMLADIQQTFSLTGISSEDARLVFARWLQSVANMPLSLQDARIHAFCRKHGITSAGLYQAADNLDISFSIVDDLVMLAEARETEEGIGSEETR